MQNLILMLSIILMLDTGSCAPEERILNGASTSIKNYPFMASLRISSRFHICGATIITPKWALTAAHCIVTNATKRISIQYGSTRLSWKGRNIVGVERVIVHEKYDPKRIYMNDIALLELDQRIKFNNKTIGPAKLPDRNHDPIPETGYGGFGVIIGWGRNSTKGKLQKDLHEVELRIYSDEECQKRYGPLITNDQLCGGRDKADRGTCYGDSGGPLLYMGTIQVGIASWVKRENDCSVPLLPGVYTKVSHYLDWIDKHISEDYC